MSVDHPEHAPLVVGAPGAEEVPSLAWPLLWRDRRRRLQSSDRYSWVVLWTVLAGLFATGFTFTIFAVSLPTVARDLHSDVTSLQWVISGPLLGFAFAMPLLGKAGDIYGHRRIYVLGFTGFIVTSLLTALAWNATSLILIRVLGSVEGAATGPASMALILGVFRPEDRVKAMGWWSLVGAGAPVMGLVAGGPIVDAFGWRWLFLAQVPMCLVALAVAAAVLHETPRRTREPLDVRGAFTLAIAATSGLLALNRGRAWGWSSPGVLLLAVLSPLGIAMFVRAERRAPHPVLPLELVRRRNFGAPISALFFANVAYMGGFILTPLLLRELFHYSVAQTSLVTMARPLSFSIAAPIAGYLAARVGERPSATVGTGLIAASMALFCLGAPGHSLALVIGALIVSGVGMGVASPSLQACAANAVEPHRLGIGSAAQQMMSQVGASVGITLLLTVQGGGRAPSLFVHAYAVGAAFAVVGIASAALLRPATRQTAVHSLAA